MNGGGIVGGVGGVGVGGAAAASSRQCFAKSGDFYHAALSTHLSLITTSSATSDGSTAQYGGVKGAGKGPGEAFGVGAASKTLKGDVAGVREVRPLCP